MARRADPIPAFGLYGETGLFPDLMHCERITDRARGLGWTIAPHRHGALHQIVLLEGAGARVSLDGGTLRIERPTLISIPRYAVHGFAFPAFQEGFVLSLLPDSLPELFGERAEIPGALSRPLAVPAHPGDAAAFEAIASELAESRPLRGAVLRAHAVTIAAAVLRAAGSAKASGDPPSPATAHMRRFERLVRHRLTEHPRVEECAAALALSPEHLGRICRRLTGLSPARFIAARRMQEARRQLAYTRAPVSQIAYDLGFADPAYFARAFRREEGQSPSAYRASRVRAGMGDPRPAP